MASLAPNLRASAASIWLSERVADLPHDVHTATRAMHLQLAITDIGQISDGWRYKTQLSNALDAWTRTTLALRTAGLGGHAETAESFGDAVANLMSAQAGGETGGVEAWLRFKDESIATAADYAETAADAALKVGATAADYAETAADAALKVGAATKEFVDATAAQKKKELKALVWLSDNAAWLVPLVVVSGATLYFWPFIGAALRARKLTSQRLTGAVDALDQRAAGFLPAPQGQPARAFEPDFEVDPYANTLEFAPVDDEPVARERWAAKAPPRRYMDKLDPMPQAQHDEDFGGGLPLVDDGTW